MALYVWITELSDRYAYNAYNTLNQFIFKGISNCFNRFCFTGPCGWSLVQNACAVNVIFLVENISKCSQSVLVFVLFCVLKIVLHASTSKPTAGIKLFGK